MSTINAFIQLAGPDSVVMVVAGATGSGPHHRVIRAGHAETMNLAGSVFKWANEGRSLVRDGKPATTVHPYDDHYGRMLREELRANR